MQSSFAYPAGSSPCSLWNMMKIQFLQGRLGRSFSVSISLVSIEIPTTWLWAVTAVEPSSHQPARAYKSPLWAMPVGAPLDRLSTDLLGSLPLTPRGNHNILVVTDYFTKWVEVLPQWVYCQVCLSTRPIQWPGTKLWKCDFSQAVPFVWDSENSVDKPST